jgi:hypothetical protein
MSEGLSGRDLSLAVYSNNSSDDKPIIYVGGTTCQANNKACVSPNPTQPLRGFLASWQFDTTDDANPFRPAGDLQRSDEQGGTFLHPQRLAVLTPNKDGSSSGRLFVAGRYGGQPFGAGEPSWPVGGTHGDLFFAAFDTGGQFTSPAWFRKLGWFPGVTDPTAPSSKDSRMEIRALTSIGAGLFWSARVASTGSLGEFHPTPLAAEDGHRSWCPSDANGGGVFGMGIFGRLDGRPAEMGASPGALEVARLIGFAQGQAALSFRADATAIVPRSLDEVEVAVSMSGMGSVGCASPTPVPGQPSVIVGPWKL